MLYGDSLIYPMTGADNPGGFEIEAAKTADGTKCRC